MREAVRALLLHDGAVLLARSHDRFDTSRSWWELPGGGVEPGEDLEQALCREVREETGYVDLQVGRQLCEWTTTWAFSDREVTQHDVVLAATLGTTRRVAPSPEEGECLEAVTWVPLELLEHLRAPIVPSPVRALIEILESNAESIILDMPERISWPNDLPAVPSVGSLPR